MGRVCSHALCTPASHNDSPGGMLGMFGMSGMQGHVFNYIQVLWYTYMYPPHVHVRTYVRTYMYMHFPHIIIVLNIKRQEMEEQVWVCTVRPM